MITDDQLYSLALFLGFASMLLIVLYHFLEVNAKDETGRRSDTLNAERRADAGVATPAVVAPKVR